MIKIFAVSGFKNSGKTTLCRRLLAELAELGVRTGYIKRSSDDVLEDGGTDTASVEKMGVAAALWGKDGLRFEEAELEPFTPEYIVSQYFPDAEIVILEGGKYLSLPKIWVENGEPRHADVRGVFMVYDRKGAGDGEMRFGEGDEALIAERLAATVRGKYYRSSKVYIGDRPLPMKDFIADFVRGAVLGMLASLKGGKDPKAPVRIYLDGEVKK